MSLNPKYGIIIAGALLISVYSGSCKKIDNGQSLSQELDGTWKLTEFGSDDNGNGKIDPWELTTVAADYNDQITFNNNGTGVETTSDNNQSSLTLNFTWTFSAKDSLYRVGTGHEDITYFLYNVSNSNLALLENTSTGLVEFYYTKK